MLLLPHSEARTRIHEESISDSSAIVFPRLTVNPKKDATGTENKDSGTTGLEGFKGYYIHIPKQAVGTKRAPLVLLLHGGGRNGSIEMRKFQNLADKYGMILLTASSLTPGRWDVFVHRALRRSNGQSTEKGDIPLGFQPTDLGTLDSALKYVLKTYAIDPTRIALLGFSDGGSYSFFLGRSNLDIFSRIAPLSGLIPFYCEGPANPSTQFFISGGLGEGDIIKQVIRMAAVLRADGHPVKTQVGLRGHVDQVEDEEFVWGWLQQSWKDPKVTTTAIPRKSSTTLLTTEALENLTNFWTGFSQLPTTIRDDPRMQHQREVWMQVGTEWTTTPMMDLRSFAAKYPEISELLQKAGLTADEADAYRKSIVEAYYTIRARLDGEAVDTSAVLAKSIKFKPIEDNSILAKNIEFLKAHRSDFEQLAKKGMLSLQ